MIFFLKKERNMKTLLINNSYFKSNCLLPWYSEVVAHWILNNSYKIKVGRYDTVMQLNYNIDQIIKYATNCLCC